MISVLRWITKACWSRLYSINCLSIFNSIPTLVIIWFKKQVITIFQRPMSSQESMTLGKNKFVFIMTFAQKFLLHLKIAGEKKTTTKQTDKRNQLNLISALSLFFLECFLIQIEEDIKHHQRFRFLASGKSRP